MTSTPNPQRRSEKSHRATLAAAMDLCSEHGYGNVTVEAIAARAGVSKKTIYRWWPTKGAVVLEAMVGIAGDATQFPDTGDITADLCTQMTAVLDHVMTGPRAAVYAGIIAETQHDAALARDLRTQLLAPRIAAARDRLLVARAHGQLAADADVDMAVDLLYGPLYYRLLLHLGTYSHDRLRSHIERVLSAFAPSAA
ncbi:TetR/AcrR family transcriptional regulator [Streptomyces sp. TRM66268-LWL]|uniref:TetR/AcrR family transcriptional regulator n=1 Tax=Streptomyces polyasparticus TaxID=2767826 RepID=A0ABR7STA8_9ACTN|nr:TetR/AcrR family transcriptional regulator [Streptomyces polyasparticus]MBC9717776.1 TetR/AcrR family transcriptional regulator [Streptomyces polyasparticus]